MTEDNTDIDESPTRDRRDSGGLSGEQTDWEDVPTDPGPDNLEYETSTWERIPVTDDDQVIFLPGNEEDLADDAFIVLEEGDLCDLVTRR
jgi:hypothetical protein